MVLDPAEKLALAVMVLLIMLGMGSTLSLKNFKEVANEPRGVLIGFLSQFGWMPLIAYGLALYFELPNYMALSMVLLGATPGGTTSNLFSYYARGNVGLSVSMTVCSTFAAIFMIPLLLNIYSGHLVEGIQIPYKDIAGALFMLLVPVSVGMFIRSKSKIWAKRIEVLASIMGLVIIASLVGLMLSKHQSVLLGASFEHYASAILLGILGFILGYFVSRALKLKHTDAKTVSLETGIQNTPLTLGIIGLTFMGHEVEMMLIPVIYGLTILITASIATLIFRVIDNRAINLINANAVLKGYRPYK
jgi:BASS family bile acid:Na+ symporter